MDAHQSFSRLNWKYDKKLDYCRTKAIQKAAEEKGLSKKGQEKEESPQTTPDNARVKPSFGQGGSQFYTKSCCDPQRPKYPNGYTVGKSSQTSGCKEKRQVLKNIFQTILLISPLPMDWPMASPARSILSHLG